MSVFSGYGITEATSDDVVLEQSTEDALFEQFLIDECCSMSDEDRKAFLESELCQQLLEAGKMRKNTIVFLSGKDDLARRTKLSAMAIAKQKKDPLFEKLRLNRIKERELLGQIVKKYGHQGERVAKKSQKDWIKNRMPSNFGKFGGSDRISH